MATSVLSVRINDDERALLEAASEQAGMSLSDFVRRRALDAAEIDLLERRAVMIPSKDWEAFKTWTRAPARQIDALETLARRTPK